MWPNFRKSEKKLAFDSIPIPSGEAKDHPSSKISDSTYMGYQYVLRPKVAFSTAYEYYNTVGMVQNAVDSYVAEVLSRDWYFDGPEYAVKAMEDWCSQYDDSMLIEYVIRDWLICGNNIIGTSDWKPIQMDSIVGLQADEYGKVSKYVQQVKGLWEDLPLPVADYIHSKFIETNRGVWGIGMFHSLMNTNWLWYDNTPVAMLDLYRRQLQNSGRSQERYAFPLNIWTMTGLSEEQWNKQKEEIKAWKPGERRLMVAPNEPKLITETIDGARAGLLTTTAEIIGKEVETGLQTSANRLITQPSAMADAREAGKKDDARLLYIMEKVRRLFQQQIIPKIVANPRKVEFHFGQQDEFDLDFAQLAQLANLSIGGKPVVSLNEYRKMLGQKGVPLDDAEYSGYLSQLDLQRQQAAQQFQPASASAEEMKNVKEALDTLTKGRRR